jgi:hypothetical protein
MAVTRTNVGRSSRVLVDMDENASWRVFLQFADKDASKRADRVLRFAKEEAPVSKAGGRVGGTLMRSIKKSQSRDVRGRWSTGYDVTSNAPYTLFVIKGTRAHRIPVSGFTPLAFFWPKLGKGVVFMSVNHPGTKANNFLGRALRRAR